MIYRNVKYQKVFDILYIIEFVKITRLEDLVVVTANNKNIIDSVAALTNSTSLTSFGKEFTKKSKSHANNWTIIEIIPLSVGKI